MAGFTMVELLIALIAMGFVLTYSLGTFSMNRNTYVVIENVSEAHQNALALAGLIERDIRNAGFMVPKATAACGSDSTTAPDLLFVSDTDAIRTVDNLPGEIAGNELRATGNIVAGWPQTITLDDLTIDAQDTYDTDATPGADSDFQQGGGVIFTDLDDPTKGVYCGIITNVAPATEAITVALSSPAPATTSGNWGFVPAHVYAITGGALERDGSLLASNVEDLQIAWFYDLDDDGQLDAGEDFGSGGAEPDLDASALADPGLLREIRWNVVLRTADVDPNAPTSAGTGQARENQTNPPGTDGRRRRVHTATIRLRNLSS